jgi:hypothetical protein
MGEKKSTVVKSWGRGGYGGTFLDQKGVFAPQIWGGVKAGRNKITGDLLIAKADCKLYYKRALHAHKNKQGLPHFVIR